MLLGDRYYYNHCFGRGFNEIKHPDQDHIASKGQGSDLNPGCLTADLLLLSAIVPLNFFFHG